MLGDERLHVVSLVFREVALELLAGKDVKGRFLALIPREANLTRRSIRALVMASFSREYHLVQKFDSLISIALFGTSRIYG